MKVKVKLDKDAILGGLIAHGEKIVFGVFLLMFVLLCFGALKQSPYDKTPEKFIAEATRVDQLVNNAVLPPEKEKDRLPPVAVIATSEIPIEKYVTKDGLNVPPGESGTPRRGEPKYLTVQDLQVGTEYGAVAMRPAGAPAAGGHAQKVAPAAQPVGGSGIEGKQWAVITGLVPSPQQVKEFRSTFANAPQSGNHDLPRWRRFEVQRQEGEGPWTPLNLQANEAAEPMEVATEPDAPELKNFTSILGVCHPAPRLVAKAHDNSIMHPKIAELAADRGVKPTPVMNNPNAARGPDLPPEYATEQLFRCFDYTVQPGKSYRYKIRLVLQNPNSGLQRYEVKDGELLKGSTRATAWSEPSPVVNVPAASSILAGPVERSRSPAVESTCQSILRMWNPERAVDALKFSKLWRGQVANYSVDTPVKPPEGGKAVEELVHFKTDLVLIDMAGGDSLPTYRGRSPSRMLLLSPTGELDVKSELVDVNTFDSELDRMRALADEAKPEPEPPPREAPKADDGGDRKRGRDRGERGNRN